MLRRTTPGAILPGLLLAVVASIANAQSASPEDANVNAIRGDANIGQTGEWYIAEWVQAKVDKLAAVPDGQRRAAFPAYRKLFRDEYGHPDNSGAYRTQLAIKTASISVEQFAKPDLDPTVAQWLAHALVDMERVETFPGLLAGLKSPVAIARFHCAKGLAALKSRIAADKEKLTRAVEALRAAGVAEKSPVVLARVYQALAQGQDVAAVFDAYLTVFDGRLAYRRGPAVIVDGAEIDALEFFRTPGVLDSLSADQKAELVRRLAVFLRLDAQRYASPELKFKRLIGTGDKEQVVVDIPAYNERVHIETMLDAIEEILAAIVGSAGGRIRDEFKSGGYERRAGVLQQAQKWVGDPETRAAGVLNVAPWNVAMGAP